MNDGKDPEHNVELLVLLPKCQIMLIYSGSLVKRLMKNSHMRSVLAPSVTHTVKGPHLQVFGERDALLNLGLCDPAASTQHAVSKLQICKIGPG